MAGRTVESYLRAAFLPRYMERLREIHDELAIVTMELERAHRRVAAECAGEPEEFERRWRALAGRWSFGYLNELIRVHNEYYPIEANLPVNPRTGDYVTFRGRPYEREELDADWVLSRFPPVLPDGRRGLRAID